MVASGFDRAGRTIGAVLEQFDPAIVEFLFAHEIQTVVFACSCGTQTAHQTWHIEKDEHCSRRTSCYGYESDGRFEAARLIDTHTSFALAENMPFLCFAGVDPLDNRNFPGGEGFQGHGSTLTDYVCCAQAILDLMSYRTAADLDFDFGMNDRTLDFAAIELELRQYFAFPEIEPIKVVALAVMVVVAGLLDRNY